MVACRGESFAETCLLEDVFRSVFGQVLSCSVKTGMEQKFINLRQAGKKVDWYAAEFSKLSRFAPFMVSTEENHARRIQQRLNLKLQRYVILFKHKTFTEVLTAAREQEQLSGLMLIVPISSLKHPIGQIIGGLWPGNLVQHPQSVR